MCQTCPCHVRLFTSSPKTSRSSLYISVSHYVSCTLLLCHKGTSVHLLPPPLDYCYTSFFFRAGPGPPHKITASGFSRSPLGRANTFSFLYISSLTPRMYRNVPPLSRCFLALRGCHFFLPGMIYFTSALYPPNLSMDGTSSWFNISSRFHPLYPSIISRPRYAILFQLALLLLTPIHPYQRWLVTSSLASSLLYIPISIFLKSLLVLSGYILSSALSSMLLVVLEHRVNSTFLSAVICTVSSSSTKFAFPSHTCPAYFSFGTITFRRRRILILVSRCESDRIAFVLPTCAVPFPITFAMCASHEQSFEISAPYTGLQSVIHLLPASIRKLPGLPYLRYIQLVRAFQRSLSVSFSSCTLRSAFPICFCNPSGVTEVFLISPPNHPQTPIPTPYAFPNRHSLLS